MFRRGFPFNAYLIAALVILISMAVSPIPAAAQDEIGTLLARINNLRASVGRAPYSLNGVLSSAAQSQAQWMVETGTIDHFRPDGSTPRSRAMNAGYPSAMVSENIYGGTNASADVAWNFWINSAIHYAGLISPNYAEVGIGIAGGGWGRAYVLVFGNPGAPPPAANNSGGGGGNNNAARAEPARIYAVGIDENGNIKHLIASGDTLGDIALIYGYTWDDIPAMLALNNMTDVRSLLPGEIFLVPPHDGTATPMPPAATDAPPSSPTLIPPTITPFVAPTNTSASIPTANALQPFVTPVIPPDVLATMRVSELPANPVPLSPEAATPTITPTLQGITVASLSTPVSQAVPPQPENVDAPRGNTQTWLIIALIVQVGIIAAAGFEFARRTLARRPSPRATGEIGQQVKRGRR